MLTKTSAIVLRSIKYGDQKIIVDFLTASYGRITCMVKVSTQPGGKMKKQLFQPLTVLDIEADIRQTQQMQKLKEVHIAMPWTTLSMDPIKISIGLFLAEVLYYSTRQDQPDNMLYRFVETSLAWLDACDAGVANFHIVFLLQLTRFLGWDIQHSEEAWQLNDLLQMDYGNMGDTPMSRQDRQRYLDIILRYYRFHVPSFPELRSLQVMKELFS